MVRNLRNGCSDNRCRQPSKNCRGSSRPATCGRHRRLGCLSAVVILVSLTARPATIACAKPSNRSFIGRRLGKRRSQKEEDTSGGLTLGDLEQMMKNKDESNLNPTPLPGPSANFGFDATSNTQQQQQYHDRATEAEESTNSNPINSNQIRRSLRRINLDLSGRIMCHIISPSRNNQGGDTHHRESVPLFSIPSLEQQSRPTDAALHSGSQELQRQSTKNKLRRRMIPHMYLGANYDLDEVWYGATRWIAKCSWGPHVSSADGTLSSSITKTNSISGNDVSSASSLRNQVWNSANQFHRKLFPSSSSYSSPNKSSWILDVEGEQSVFDHSDSTVSVRILQSPQLVLSNVNRAQQTTLQQISMEYDSAKYDDATTYTTKRHIQYAPTITMDLKTPFLHPRLEIHSKKTWIVKEGGDNDGNYYGGDHYGSASCVDRRLEQIKERFREGIPRSNPISNPGSSPPGRVVPNNNFGNRLSRWLENDGWMPRKVTTDLMGNLVSVSDVGLGANTIATTKPVDSNDSAKFKKTPLQNSIIPPIHNTGIRLRISKKIDWVSLGIFPWSKNSSNQQSTTGMFDALQSVRVRLELCGLYGSEEKCASVGVDVDPLDWSGTLKVVVRQEDVSVLGSR